MSVTSKVCGIEGTLKALYHSQPPEACSCSESTWGHLTHPFACGILGATDQGKKASHTALCPASLQGESGSKEPKEIMMLAEGKS